MKLLGVIWVTFIASKIQKNCFGDRFKGKIILKRNRLNLGCYFAFEKNFYGLLYLIDVGPKIIELLRILWVTLLEEFLICLN